MYNLSVPEKIRPKSRLTARAPVEVAYVMVPGMETVSAFALRRRAGRVEQPLAIHAGHFRQCDMTRRQMMKDTQLSLGITLMIGLILGGYLVGDGIRTIKTADRYVTVKGLSEKNVKADLAAWNIVFTSQAATFDKAIAKNKTDQEKLVGYLKKQGLKDDNIEIGTPRVQQNVYNQNVADSDMRYSIEHSILIKSRDVGLIKTIATRSSEILQLGVALSGWNEPNYYFTSLNAVKPGMIAEATVSARKAAEKFAQDSASKVGKIRNARQGQFSFHGVAGLEQTTQIDKVVRVVISVDYFLID